MERLEDLENIVDTLSILINEVESKDLKSQLEEIQQDFYEEKEEVETNIRVMNAKYEAECRRDLELMRW